MRVYVTCYSIKDSIDLYLFILHWIDLYLFIYLIVLYTSPFSYLSSVLRASSLSTSSCCSVWCLDQDEEGGSTELCLQSNLWLLWLISDTLPSEGENRQCEILFFLNKYWVLCCFKITSWTTAVPEQFKVSVLKAHTSECIWKTNHYHSTFHFTVQLNDRNYSIQPFHCGGNPFQ